MTNAFLYDSLCGLVYRCMFAGVDGCGRAQWVNITPGEEPKTLEDYVTDEDNDSCCDILADVDGFDSMDELFRTVRTYFLVMETLAGISCLTKDLRINEKLRKEAKRNDLGMFDHIEDEAYVLDY